MTWATTPPTAPGWYWWLPPGRTSPDVVEVFEARHGPGAPRLEIDEGSYGGPVASAGGEWWPAPIPEPPRGLAR